ncbi:Rieske 2Fe-2S domain-containing protein [Saccharothrix syringae]|uniref:DoxX family membrane protein n=1 Tax=Saccharothrix syringae TaxID=103733 RepID=A0A5Q0GV16_SACSY|nr:Rieske 2Fe-2S domain-containing protein [Saccharothrix syringae]QFZ17761.1 DoxX family membrane protein [Saccharothrix syringae]
MTRLRLDSPRRSPVWVLLPLRAFLGGTFAYAGLSKLFDAHYLDDTSPLGVHAQMVNAAATSPIGPLVSPAADHATVIGLAVALGEVAVGLATLLGLFTRLAALGGVLLSLGFFLTVSWTTRPYYLGADIVFAFAWTPLLIAGDAGVLSLSARLRAKVRHRLGLPVHPTPEEDGTVRDDVERRTVLRGALIAGAATAAGIPAGSALALARRPAGPPADPVGHGPVIAAVDDIAVGSSASFTMPDGTPAHLLRPAPDTFLAFNATCSHQGCPVAYVGPGFRCPCHGATYGGNGEVTGGPAPEPLVKIPVEVVEGQVVLA